MSTTTSSHDDEAAIKSFLFVVYVYILMFLVMSANRGQFDQAKEINSMNQRILRAVYSQPATIKAEIERQAGMGELGNVPPIADLTSFGAHAKGYRAQIGKRSLLRFGPYFFGVIVGVIASWNSSISLGPYVALLLLAVAGQWAAIHYGGLRKPMDRECKCCVCGKVASLATNTTTGAKKCASGDDNNDLETALLDCKNCNDTGVCSPACPKCDESNSMVNAMFSGPAACHMCSLYKFLFGACGIYFRHFFRRNMDKGGSEEARRTAFE